jgi:Trypsin-like peptidase domain
MQSINYEDIKPFLTVARISTYDDETGTVLRNGTGFFYSNPKGDVFLITNRHVIKDEPWYIPNIVRLSLYANRENLKGNQNYDIPLYENGKPIWREPHPFADVVAIPINIKEIQERDLLIESFSDIEFQTKLHLEIGEDILVMGYPLGCYYDNVFNLPVIRSGTLASAYPVPYQGKPHFLIDARLHEGTSGSPVITKLKNLMETLGPGMAAGRLRFVLLGVNSSTWPLPKGE